MNYGRVVEIQGLARALRSAKAWNCSVSVCLRHGDHADKLDGSSITHPKHASGEVTNPVRESSRRCAQYPTLCVRVGDGVSKAAFLKVLGGLAAAYLAVFAYVITQQDIEPLLICADAGGLKLPFSNAVCKAYLLQARGTPEDMAVLQSGIGASFVVQGQASPDERLQILRFLQLKGLDINQLDAEKLTPLHASVLANRPDEVKILLQAGADNARKDAQFNLTLMELALKLQGESHTPNGWQSVIDLLQQTTPLR